jgi:hypothetical protein
MIKLSNLLENPAIKKLAKREHLKELITKTSKANGGDDPVFLHTYITEVLYDWDDHLDQAILCFEEILLHHNSMKGMKL